MSGDSLYSEFPNIGKQILKNRKRQSTFVKKISLCSILKRVSVKIKKNLIALHQNLKKLRKKPRVL